MEAESRSAGVSPPQAGLFIVLLYRITASSKHKQTKQFPHQQGCGDPTSAHMYTVRKYFVNYRHGAEFIILSYNFKTCSVLNNVLVA